VQRVARRNELLPSAGESPEVRGVPAQNDKQVKVDAVNKWYRFVNGHGPFWPAVFEVRDAHRAILADVVTDILIARYESMEVKPVNPTVLASHLHDDFFVGKFWKFNFMMNLVVVPSTGRPSFLVKCDHFGFPLDWFPGFSGKEEFTPTTRDYKILRNWDQHSVVVPVMDQELFSSFVGDCYRTLNDFKSYEKGPHFRDIQQLIAKQGEVS